MAMLKQSVTLTRSDDDIVIAIGPETFAVSLGDLTKRRNGARSIEDLLFQFEVALQLSGVDPNTATLAQMKNAIESRTYWWGAS